MSKETLNPFEIAQKQVKSACDKLNADPAVYEILKNPMRFLEVSFPVKSPHSGSYGPDRLWHARHHRRTRAVERRGEKRRHDGVVRRRRFERRIHPMQLLLQQVSQMDNYHLDALDE